MFLPFAVIAALVVFGIQMILCFRKVCFWGRWIPLILLMAGEVVCWICTFLDNYAALPYGAAFSAHIFALILWVFIAADLCAWLAWTVISLAQKRRK